VDRVVPEGMSQVSRRSEVVYINSAPSTPGYLLALLRELSQCLGPLQKLPSQSRYEKWTWHVFCTTSKKGLENRSSRFEPQISWISFSRSSGPPLNPPFFVLWFSSSEGFWNFYYTSQILKMFQTLEGKSFLEWNPVIIAPNFEIGVEHCVPFLVFLFYHWTRWGKFHHVRPHGCERPCTKAIFLPSIFCRSLLCTASPLRRRKHLLDKTWKCSINLPNQVLDHTHAHRVKFLFSPSPKHRQFVFAA